MTKKQSALILEIFDLIQERTKEWPEEEVIPFLQELTAESALAWRQTQGAYINKMLTDIADDLKSEFQG